MSRRDFTHLHRTGVPGRVTVHDPDGNVRGYIQRVRFANWSRPGFAPLDERGQELAAPQDSQYRALEWVTER